MPEIPIDEVQGGFPVEWIREFPPVLNLKLACRLAYVSESTLKRWVREGKFRGSAKQKKPMLFWRNRFIVELFALNEHSRSR